MARCAFELCKVSALWLAIGLGGCAGLSPSPVSLSGARLDEPFSAVRVSVDPAHPVLLRAVDEELLPSIQVSNHLRPLAYVLHPGAHVFWLSELPYGMPFLPQRINCFVMRVTLVAGAGYELRLDPRRKLPVLSRTGEAEPESVGQVVDRPLLLERGCQWR
ncbi:hypothetical protein [Hydrogenophaga sp.]|uniref:hypothetical protein n=1 Tax=Hydrogenophaga sp. TaxID=1904254 RepID=UPI003F71158B